MSRCLLLAVLLLPLMASLCGAFSMARHVAIIKRIPLPVLPRPLYMALSNAPETTTTAATTTTISSTDNNNNNDEEDSVVSLFSDAASRLNFTLTNHVPLGCIIDESLAVSSSSERLVFISQIKDQSNAQAAGLQVGDVIVGVSSLFGTLVENVTFAGIEKIRNLVSSCPPELPLHLHIVRGSNVLYHHEQALVELCTITSASDQQTESCLMDYIQGGYNDEEDDLLLPVECDSDDDTECLLDSIYGLWADELPMSVYDKSLSITTDDNNNNNNNKSVNPNSKNAAATAAAVKPWSSRSSPSGTWVRDPATGMMRNIDEQENDFGQ